MTEYRVIVAGGRDFDDKNLLKAAIYNFGEALGPHYGMSIVSGMAAGADRLAYQLAIRDNIKCYAFPAHWDTHGRAAGFVRNREMAEVSDALIAFHDGTSKGTANMINIMRDMGKPVLVYLYRPGEHYKIFSHNIE